MCWIRRVTFIASFKNQHTHSQPYALPVLHFEHTRTRVALTLPHELALRVDQLEAKD